MSKSACNIIDIHTTKFAQLDDWFSLAEFEPFVCVFVTICFSPNTMAAKRLKSELNVGETKIARKDDPSTVSLLRHYFDP